MQGENQDSQHISHPGTCSSSSSWPPVDPPHIHQTHHNYHHDSNHYDHHNSNHYDHHHHHGNHPNGHGNHSNGHVNHSNGPFHPVPFSVRKRAWLNANQGHPPDHFENTHVKLYVAQVSRTATEEVIRPVFEQFGSIVEVVILRDKMTGQQQGSCFVKYATIDEAERAIRALNNQHYFPGEVIPITVKYADGEKERLGVLDKLYICGLSKEASKKDIEEIFSPYGFIEDIYILRDELRRNCGSGFVKFSHRDMALAAIKALNGTFTMRGCSQPLIVRFADPKKPRIEPRGNYAFGSGNISAHSQEPVPRLVSDHGDSVGGYNLHNASYNVQQTSHPPVFQLANQEPQASSVMQPAFPPLTSPSQLCTMNLQQTQNTHRSSQTSQGEVNETQKQHLTQPSGQIIGQQQSSQSPQTGRNPQTVTSATVPSSHEIGGPLECDWSEHTCPNGDKYYYNCETCESRWDKPEEFAFFEKQLQMQTQLQNPSHHLQSLSPVLSTQQSSQTQQVQIQTQAFHQTLQLQQPSLSGLELDHVQIQPETSPVVGPTCV